MKLCSLNIIAYTINSVYGWKEILANSDSICTYTQKTLRAYFTLHRRSRTLLIIFIHYLKLRNN